MVLHIYVYKERILFNAHNYCGTDHNTIYIRTYIHLQLLSYVHMYAHIDDTYICTEICEYTYEFLFTNYFYTYT